MAAVGVAHAPASARAGTWSAGYCAAALSSSSTPQPGASDRDPIQAPEAGIAVCYAWTCPLQPDGSLNYLLRHVCLGTPARPQGFLGNPVHRAG